MPNLTCRNRCRQRSVNSAAEVHKLVECPADLLIVDEIELVVIAAETVEIGGIHQRDGLIAKLGDHGPRTDGNDRDGDNQTGRGIRLEPP